MPTQKESDAFVCDLTPEHVLAELAEIAFADPAAEAAPPVKTADKLRALEMLYKHLGLGEKACDEGVIIVDEE
ncbi:hypothetical protein [Gemmiger sp.]|uniref:hypothetical protein n=1 Tax=Gemmiger sp. TaxID=2049027 RepID=UPI0025E3E2B4|nr:hypothetical protein [Gemmiger sp.]MDY2695134.1 hypothetical protein [Gemmiger sp.]